MSGRRFSSPSQGEVVGAADRKGFATRTYPAPAAARRPLPCEGREK